MEVTPWISNGTCYVAANTPSDPIFIPCGNDAFGHKTCCKAGEVCLTNNACYDGEFGITYLLGCSDPDYLDPACPDKRGVKNGGWVGLVTCAGSNDWAPCSQKAQPSTLKKADQCSCDPTSHPVAFRAPPHLDDIVSLPTKVGESVHWISSLPTVTVLPTAATPTPTPTLDPASNPSTAPAPPPTTTSASLPQVPTQTVVITATPTLDASPSTAPSVDTTSGLSTGTKAGIGAGAGAGGLLIFAALMYFLIMLPRRRQKKQSQSPEVQYTSVEPRETKYPVGPSTPGTVATSAVSELDSTAARPWSLRSELPGGESPRSMGTAFEENRMSDGRAGDGRYAGYGYAGNGLGVHGQGGGQPRLESWAELQ